MLTNRTFTNIFRCDEGSFPANRKLISAEVMDEMAGRRLFNTWFSRSTEMEALALHDAMKNNPKLYGWEPEPMGPRLICGMWSFLVREAK